jgi:hypothetical protein
VHTHTHHCHRCRRLLCFIACHAVCCAVCVCVCVCLCVCVCATGALSIRPTVADGCRVEQQLSSVRARGVSEFRLKPSGWWVCSQSMDVELRLCCGRHSVTPTTCPDHVASHTCCHTLVVGSDCVLCGCNMLLST